MATLAREFLRRVCTTLGDLSPQFRRWSEVELVQATNDGQIALAKYLPSAGGRVDSVKLVPGSIQHLGTIPADRNVPGTPGVWPASSEIEVIQVQGVICNMGSNGSTPGAAITPVQRELLDAYNRAWRTSGDPLGEVEHFTFNPQTPRTIEVYPPVRSIGGDVWVMMELLACPKPLPMPAIAGAYAVAGSSTAVLGVPDTHVDDLHNYVLARMWMKDAETAGNAQLAQMHANLFVQSVNAQATVQTGHNPNLKMLPFAPAAPATAS